MPPLERQRRGGGDSRDRDDVWRRLGAAGSKGRGQRRRRRRGGFGFISLFSILRITYPGIFFASYVAGKATRTQGALRRREGQTAYYVERKALGCGARKATLILQYSKYNIFYQNDLSHAAYGWWGVRKKRETSFCGLKVACTVDFAQK